jgi:hypothetical protein
VLAPAGVLPQAAERLDTRPELWPDEVRVRVERLNLDAASYRQLSEKHGGDGAAVRAEVLDIVATRGKMQNPVTGSGGMLIGTVEEVGPESTLGVEGGAILATADRGTVIFFSMATSFSAAALGAEGLAADVTMLVGNGYVPGHAAYAMELLRTTPGVRALFEARLAAER